MVKAKETWRLVAGQSCSGMMSRERAVSLRLKRLHSHPIDFIMDASFESPDQASERDALERDVLSSVVAAEEPAGKVPSNLPGHLARLCETRVLDAEEEREYFWRMNYLKFRAHQLQTNLDVDAPDVVDLERAERFMAVALSLRNHLIRANVRLAIAVVRRYVTPRHSFDELLSDSLVTLMHAVDKFDVSRGFRFSTYAYRAISRNTYRHISKSQNESVRFSQEAAEAIPDGLGDESGEEDGLAARARLQELLARLLHGLDRREQFIVRCRFGLGAHRKTRTFQSIADRLGVSKERVRQLEQRAMSKLRTLAAQMDIGGMVEFLDP